MAKILCISDLHVPFHHLSAFDFLRDMAKNLRPDSVICLGDEIDSHNFAKWPREPDAIGPVEELSAARGALKTLAKLFPKLTIVDSNHTYRPWKLAASKGLCASFLRSRQQILDTPDGWCWVQAARIEDVTYFHGEGFQGASAARDAATTYLSSCVIGHIHAHAGVAWRTSPTGVSIFGMNVGCLIDISQPAFNYASKHRHKPVLGAGMVIDGIPYFVPMLGAGDAPR